MLITRIVCIALITLTAGGGVEGDVVGCGCACGARAFLFHVSTPCVCAPQCGNFYGNG